MKRHMKHTLLTILTLLTFSATAATQASLPLKGKVALLLGIDITATPAAATLNLTQNQTNLKVADGHIYSNSGTGFKITVSSSNQGRLKRVGGSEYFSYALKFGPVDVPLNTSTPLVFNYPDPLNYSDAISVSYTGVPASSLVAGDYTDTITFTITAL